MGGLFGCYGFQVCNLCLMCQEDEEKNQSFKDLVYLDKRTLISFKCRRKLLLSSVNYGRFLETGLYVFILGLKILIKEQVFDFGKVVQCSVLLKGLLR